MPELDVTATTYPVRADIPVRFRDIDGLGHVNNAVVMTYLEIARETYWRRAGLGLDISDYAFLLARSECDFRAPIPYGETVAVHLGCPRLGTKSWDFVYRVESADGQRLYAQARTVQVAVEFPSGRSCEIPAGVRAAFARIEGRDQPSAP